MQSFKKLMSFRKITLERKSDINQNNDEPIKYRRQTSNTFIAWNMLCHNNLLFFKYEHHNTIITTKSYLEPSKYIKST